MKPVEFLVIHCTATPQRREVTGAQIRLWHTAPPPAGRGWKQVGYTDMIHLNGGVERLAANNDDGIVDAWEITNGVAGMNSRIRSIVYVGGLDKAGVPMDTRTREQKEAMKKYVFDFIRRNPTVKVAGHNQFSSKHCPSFNVPDWLRLIGVKPQNIKE
ncbi:MAG: N-acetylmuramoyl-L-alanine amidase [Bacteroidales bacterium]